MPKKHMRLPNGFGQITKISNKNLRRPYRAMVTVDKTPEGKPICKILKPQGYFETYNEAYEALIEYKKNPYDLEPGITLEELYEKWLEKYKLRVSGSEIRNTTSSWRYCGSLYKMSVSQIRVRHLKGCIENINGSANLKFRVKSLFNKLFDYAVEYEIVDRNYARAFTLDSDLTTEAKTSKNDHIVFTDEELEILWKNQEDPIVQMILVQCYSGWRPQELVKIENINLEEKYFVGGMKTKAGKGRKVPIHSKIYEIAKKNWEMSLSRGHECLFTCPDGTLWTYDKYYKRFQKTMERLGLSPAHRPHDPRKTFVTMAKRMGVNEYAVKRIIGHEITDLTERVYTDRDFNWLIEEIEKL